MKNIYILPALIVLLYFHHFPIILFLYYYFYNFAKMMIKTVVKYKKK